MSSVARGMVLGDVERLEIVVGRLDFRPFDHGEADGKKNPLKLFVGLADQVPRQWHAPRPAAKGRFDRAPPQLGSAAASISFRFASSVASTCALSLFSSCRRSASIPSAQISASCRRSCEDAGFASSPGRNKNAPVLGPRNDVWLAPGTAGAIPRSAPQLFSGVVSPSCPRVCVVGSVVIERCYAVVGAGLRPAPTKQR